MRTSTRASGRLPGRLRLDGRGLAATALAVAAGPALAQVPLRVQPEDAQLPAGIAACAQVRLDAERLACYDRFVAPIVRGAADGAASGASGVAAAGADAGASSPAAAGRSPAEQAVAKGNGLEGHAEDAGGLLDPLWELSADRKRGTFNFTGYRPNYFFPARYTSAINRTPHSPAADRSGGLLPDYRHYEAKLQLSVRTKMLEDVGLPGGDLWFGYTQQSLWQLYTPEESRPFRATDHEPEIFYVVPVLRELPGGIRLQMAGIGVAHQSNGQSLPFSRSWNRVWAMAGLEYGNTTLTVKQNWRMHESDGQDDNADLTRWRGRTELLAAWLPGGGSTLSALWRTNFTAKGGSIQLDWTRPVNRADPKGLRWYVQAFHGYAETLIDYNFRQTSVGAGVTLFGW